MTDTRTIKTGTYGRFTVARCTLKTGAMGYSVTFDYDDREVRRMRKLGAQWLQGSKVWFVPSALDAHFSAYLATEG